MLLIDLFDRDNILCPEWLVNEDIDDDWIDSSYSFNGEYHTWTLDNIFGKLRICFNGKEYHFQSLNENEDWIPFKFITANDVIVY